MFIMYFALWVILNGRWTLEIGAFGVVFAALLYAFSCAFMGFSVKTDLVLARHLADAIRYGVLLVGEIVRANLAVIRMILNPSYEVKPQLVTFHSGLHMERHRVALANSITLTPGTITCHLEGDTYVVHCLDASLVEGLDDGTMVSALADMEREAPVRQSEPDRQSEPENLTADAAAACGQDDLNESSESNEPKDQTKEDAGDEH